ncbi:MAG: hypothetical protein WCY11_12605 [Novosphingobium sp.]
MNNQRSIEEAAERVIELESELESAGIASLAADELAFARAQLHAWVDTVVGVVAAAGTGRVTLIHANGRRTGIASPELPFLLTPPAKFTSTGGD